MEEMFFSRLSDGIIGHETEVLIQVMPSFTNEYGCEQHIEYMLMPDNRLFVDEFIEGCFARSLAVIY